MIIQRQKSLADGPGPVPLGDLGDLGVKGTEAGAEQRGDAFVPGGAAGRDYVQGFQIARGRDHVQDFQIAPKVDGTGLGVSGGGEVVGVDGINGFHGGIS
jgi:hypothetical protein